MSTEPDYSNAAPPTSDELAVLKARQDAATDALALDNEVRAQRIRKQAQALVAAEGEPSTQDDTSDLLVDGATFLLDLPEGVPAIWGAGTDVLWAQGEALLIAGPPGVGKTTLISHVLVSMLGIGGTHVLGLPVAPARKVLYLAMDRPQQIARALSRHVRAEHRTILADAPGGVEGTATSRPGQAPQRPTGPGRASRGRRGGDRLPEGCRDRSQ